MLKPATRLHRTAEKKEQLEGRDEIKLWSRPSNRLRTNCRLQGLKVSAFKACLNPDLPNQHSAFKLVRAILEFFFPFFTFHCGLQEVWLSSISAAGRKGNVFLSDDKEYLWVSFNF